jgi:hypothetical protein
MRRQCRPEIVGGQAQLARVPGQPAVLVRCMADRMRRRAQLGEDKNNNEKKMAQGTHGLASIDLDEQPFEIFPFGKVQGDRMVGGAGQAADDARLAPGIAGRASDDLLEQFEADAAGA